MQKNFPEPTVADVVQRPQDRMLFIGVEPIVALSKLQPFAEIHNISVHQLKIWWNELVTTHPYPAHNSMSRRECIRQLQMHCNGWCFADSIDVCSPRARSSRKFYLPDIFGDEPATHKVLPLGYQWGKHLDPDPTKVCDHPGCSRPGVAVEASVLPCGHSFHRVCAEIVNQSARSEVSIHQLVSDNIYVDRIHRSDESMVCAICEEGLTLTTFLMGRKAKELVEQPKAFAESNDADEAAMDTTDAETKPWTIEQIYDAVTAANNKLIPP